MPLFLKFKVLVFLLPVALSCLIGDMEAVSENKDPGKFQSIDGLQFDNGKEELLLMREEQRKSVNERASMDHEVSGFYGGLSKDASSVHELKPMAGLTGKISEASRNRRDFRSHGKQPLAELSSTAASKFPPTTVASAVTSRSTTTSASSSSRPFITTPPFPPPPPPPPPPSEQFVANCSSSFSCRGRCQTLGNSNNKEDKYLCNCDEQCEMFQDCCADFDQFCPLPNNSLPSSSSGHWNCHSDIWMIDKCPGNWPINPVYFQCTNNPVMTADNYEDVIPVVSTSGKTYRNRFCAQCHGEYSDNIEYYGLDFKCEISPPQGYSTREAVEFLFKYCRRIQWQPKQGQHHRKCINPAIEGSCSFGDDFLCTVSPLRVVFDEMRRVNYKNMYCASCNMPSDELISSLTCGPGSEDVIKGPPASFSIIMNIGGNEMDSQHKDREMKVECEINEVYDIFLDVCRPVYQRTSILTSSQFDKYRIALWIKSKFPLSIYGNDVISNFLRISLAMDNNTELHIIHCQNLKAQDIETLIFEVQLSKNVRPRTRCNTAGITIESLLNFTEPVNFLFRNHIYTIIKATSRLLTCVHVEYFTPENYVVVHGSSSIYINQTQELLTEKQYVANSTETHNGYRIPVGWIAVCRQHLPSTLTCNGTYISLEKDEYVMLPNNSVYRNVSNTVYKQGEYSIINGSVIVCTEYSNKYTKTERTDESQNDTALRILTYIGLSLSVVCLVLVLVTYLLFGELRTLPGINLMNLSSALLVAHFFWLIGSGQTGSHGACVAIAVLLHYSFLASFVWMSIIAFSTWKIFSTMRQAGTSTDQESRKKKIRCTLAVGWLPVLVVVLICLGLDQSGAVEIGYGGAKGCWINNGRANLFIFVLPIAASVLWNAVFFGLTVRSLRKVTQQTRMVKEQRNYNAVYIKIAVLMGFTWVFGFLASFVSPYFHYPFVALNTIQGVYIAVCFTFTRRVKNLYMTRIEESKITRRNYNKTENVNQLSTDTCNTRV